VNDYDRAILAEFLRRQKAKRTGFAHSYYPNEPTPKQRAFLDFDGLEGLYGGAAGGGKSDALLAAALKYVHVPGYAALLLRQSFSDLALDGALMDRARKWLMGTDARWNDRDKRWRFPSGATLSFGYLENELDKYRYQSAEFQFIGFDELTQFTQSQYTYMFSRLRRAGIAAPLRMRAATNPGGVGHKWVKARWKLPDDVNMGTVYTGTDGALFFPATLDDNPYIDRTEYELALSKLTAIDQDQLRKGRWVQDSSMLVYAFDAERDIIERLPRLPAGMFWRRVLGIDYGNVDATALVVLAFCTAYSDKVYIEKSDAWTDLDPDDAAEVVRKWSLDAGGFERMVGDTGGLGKGYVVQAQRRFALPIEAADKSDKLGSIKLINGAAEKGRVLIVKGANDKLVKELEELRWKDEKKLQEHPGLANHLCDARLYAWKETTAWMHVHPDEQLDPSSPEAIAKREREEELAEIEATKREEAEW
jgi:hypothetical protein